MSARFKVATLQASRISAALNVCPDDSRFFAWLNEAEDMMLNQGRWYGSVTEAQFCQEGGCITWPREVATVEQAAVCGMPIDIANGWYAFTRLLTTLRHCNGGCGCNERQNSACRCGHLTMRMREGTVASFATTIGANKKIRCYPGSAADVGKKLIFEGRDSNGIWVRTTIDGVVSDGEQVVLALPFVDTTTVWGPGAPTAVTKDITTMRVLVYEYDTVTTLERALAEYAPGETLPSYQQSYIPGIGTGGCCGCSSNGDTTRKTITALVSLQHVELASPNDWLVLQNLSAYKAAMIAVKAWEEGDAAKGNFYFYGTAGPSKNGRGALRVVNRGGAIPLLQAELRKMTGDRVNAFITVDSSDKFAQITMGMR